MRAYRPTLRFLFLGLIGLALAGCRPSSTIIERFADPEKQKIALAYLQRLNAGQVEGLTTELDPSLRSSNTAEQFKVMASAVINQKPATTNLIGYFANYSGGGTTYNLTYQFGYGSNWVVENVAWREQPNHPRVIVGMSARRLSESLQVTNALTLKRAHGVHYVFLLGLIAVPLFCVATVIVCIRTKGIRRKWLWILFILFGFCTVSLNWTTADVSCRPISVLLLGAAGVASSIYSPWVFSLGVPLGAITFWIFRRRIVSAPVASESSTPQAGH